MPSQTQYFTTDPNRLDIINKLKRLLEPDTAIGLSSRALLPYRRARERNLRNIAPGSGQGLGAQAQYGADLDAQLASDAIQRMISAGGTAGGLTPQYSKITQKTSLSPLETLNQVVGTVGNIAGLSGEIAGGIAGVQDIGAMLSGKKTPIQRLMEMWLKRLESEYGGG